MNLNNLLILLKEIDDPDPIQDEKQLLKSHLERLVENIFKLQYWEVEQGRDYRHWETMVCSSRDSIHSLFQNNLSLVKHAEQMYPKIYQDTVKSWQSVFYIPSNIPIMLEQILKEDYYG